MAITLDDYKNVRVNPAVMAVAYDLSRVTEAMRKAPDFSAVASGKEPAEANREVVGSGIAALTDYLSVHPNAPVDEGTKVKGRLNTFNAVQAIRPNLPPDAIARVAANAFDRMSSSQQVQVASLDPGAALGIVNETLKANVPQARSIGQAGSDTATITADPANGRWLNGRWVIGSLRSMAGADGRSSGRFNEIDDRHWSPDSGADGLNEKNFPASFRAAGVNLAAAQFLLRQGFNAQQIVAAGEDTRTLGFKPNDKEALKDFADVDRLDHGRRKERMGLLQKLREAGNEDPATKDLVEKLAAAKASGDEDAIKRARQALCDHGLALQAKTGFTDFAGRAPTEAARKANVKAATDTQLNDANQRAEEYLRRHPEMRGIARQMHDAKSPAEAQQLYDKFAAQHADDPRMLKALKPFGQDMMRLRGRPEKS